MRWGEKGWENTTWDEMRWVDTDTNIGTNMFEPLTLFGQCLAIGSNHILFLARTVAEGLPIMSSNSKRAPPFQLSSMITFVTSRVMFARMACVKVSSECSRSGNNYKLYIYIYTFGYLVNIPHDLQIKELYELYEFRISHITLESLCVQKQ